jgi:4-hydroxybenzoate polyprenyltransferase
LLAIHLAISCCALLLCLAAEKTFLGVVPPLFSPLHGLLFASTLVAYNVHALVNGPWLTGDGMSVGQKRLHTIVTVVAAVVVVCLLPFVSQKLWIGLVVLAVITAAYSTPLLPFRYKQRLKDFGTVKLAVLVGTWVLCTTWLPALKWGIPVGDYWPELVIRTALLLALCIAFDIRDVAADRAAGIHTLPVQIGIRAAYGVAHGALALCVLFVLLLPTRSSEMLTAVCIGCLFAVGAVEWSRRRPSESTYLLLVDGALAVYAGAVLLL